MNVSPHTVTQHVGSTIETTKSPRQIIEDASISVSPREIKKKFAILGPTKLSDVREVTPVPAPEVVTPRITKKVAVETFTPPPKQDSTASQTEKEISNANLFSAWEKRISVSGGVPDIARLAVSPRGGYKKKRVPKTENQKNDSSVEKKSTKQTMEDLSVFVSPRQIKKKFIITPRQPPETHRETESPVLKVGTRTSATKATMKVFPPPSPPQQKAATPSALEEAPKVSTIRDRMKAFERNHCDPNHTGDGGPLMAQGLRGKRGSVLDKFTPKQQAKEKVIARRKQDTMQKTPEEELPEINLFRPEASFIPSTPPAEAPPERSFVPEDPVPSAKSVQQESSSIPSTEMSPSDDEILQISVEEIVSSTYMGDQTEEPHDITEDLVSSENLATEIGATDKIPESPSTWKQTLRIDRDTLVLEEIRKMIRDTEDNELEEEMDMEVKGVLERAALESPAYTKRWYDALTDSWVHCPSLATIIMDFSLIEAAEKIYGEELPMLYSVSLRAVASDVMQGEEELPEYVYRLAS